MDKYSACYSCRILNVRQLKLYIINRFFGKYLLHIEYSYVLSNTFGQILITHRISKAGLGGVDNATSTMLSKSINLVT